MKLRPAMSAMALAAAGVCSLPAHALSPSETATGANVVRVYMSGATALRAIIGGLFTQNCAKDAGGNTVDLDVFYSGVGTYGGVAFTTAGDAHRVYSCTFAANASFLAGKKVALYKSDIGGSGQGVFPVYFGSISPFPTRSFLTVNDPNCPGPRAATIPNYTCSTAEQQQVPMVGVSDAEPALFKTINVPEDDPTYPQDGLSPTQLAALAVTPLFQTVFGVAVNKSLRDAMQTAQGLTAGSEVDAQQPTISKGQAASYFAGVLGDPSSNLGWQTLVSATDPKRGTRVNVCRRVPGSGTQAAANAYFANFPASSDPLNVARFDVSDTGLTNASSSVGATGSLFVFEGSTTGNVIACLNQADAAGVGAYAIGHVSRENVPAAGANWRHVKLDGFLPSRDNVKSGLYNYFYESTVQWATVKFNSLTVDQRAFLTGFRDEARRPASLALLSTAAQGGVAALPDTYPGAFGTGTAPEITFGSRVSRGGNSKVDPLFFK
jgi:hypothetical protein